MTSYLVPSLRPTSRASSSTRAINIDRRKILLEEPLKHVGEFNVLIKLHRDVIVPVKVAIAKEAVAEEAGQSAGEESGAEA